MNLAPTTIPDDVAAAVADALVGPPLDNHVTRAYRVDHEALVDQRHPKRVGPGQYTAHPRTIVVVGRRFGR